MSTNDSDPPGSERAPRRRGRGIEIDALFGRLQESTPELAKARANSIGMKLVLLPEATFEMGSPPSERQHRGNEAPVHEVILTYSFYVGIHPVTQEQYQHVLGVNPARFQRDQGGGLDHPVEQVSWEDAVLFCRKLSESPHERAEGLIYRLPSEAEWEYACRAGTTGPFNIGGGLTSTQANMDGNHPYGEVRKDIYLGKTSRVGSYPANHFGLFDMHGNVWQWCSDWYGEAYYAASPSRDPRGPVTGTLRVVRGGCWRSQASSCRSAYRNALVPYNRDAYTGFRVVATLAGS